MSLEDLAIACGEGAITELKVILKADVRGSVEAIRKELEKLQHEEVRVRVLHTGIGAITESDVQLALARRTIIVGFNVVPDDEALALAEGEGVQIREYDIIYKLTDDIRAALEGKLKPTRRSPGPGGRPRHSRSAVGTIAGCYVTRASSSGPPRSGSSATAWWSTRRRTGRRLDSLKRFKDDVREVREGFECGIKIAGYDDDQGRRRDRVLRDAVRRAHRALTA